MLLDRTNPPPEPKRCRHAWTFYAWVREPGHPLDYCQRIDRCRKCGSAKISDYWGDRPITRGTIAASLEEAILGRPVGVTDPYHDRARLHARYVRSSLPRRCRHKWLPYRWTDGRTLIERCRCGQARIGVWRDGELEYLTSYAESVEEALLGRPLEPVEADKLGVN